MLLITRSTGQKKWVAHPRLQFGCMKVIFFYSCVHNIPLRLITN
jgi:hypothetical protein